ncbi:multidrug resistance-associated protein 5 [Tanacetum coccineum]
MAFSECFNSVIVNVRHKPLLTILEAIRVIVLERMNKIREISRKWNPGVCPNIKKRLEWLKEKQRFWHVIPGGGKLFEVRLGSEGFTVDEGKRTCSCKMWQLSGLLCVHAIKRGPMRDEGACGTRGGAIGSRGKGGAAGSRGGASRSIGSGAGGSGGVSGSRGRGTTGLRGGASGSIDEPEQSQDEPEKTQAEPQQTQHKPEQTQVEDQVEQTKDQAEIDLTQVEQTQEQMQPQEQPQQAALRMPSARILQRKLGKQGSSQNTALNLD